ncbi:MAG: hypothetical protein RSC06_03405 [Clostridia bacterium]
MSYTYNPAEIVGNTVSRARFELGDVLVDGGAETCMLSDEEIGAIIAETQKWKVAMYRLADAVCMRLSYETDWRDDGTSFNLSQRVERWQQICDRLKKDADACNQLPTSGAVRDSVTNPEDGGHYFYGGMMQSPYVAPPYPFAGGKN